MCSMKWAPKLPKELDPMYLVISPFAFHWYEFSYMNLEFQYFAPKHSQRHTRAKMEYCR